MLGAVGSVNAAWQNGSYMNELSAARTAPVVSGAAPQQKYSVPEAKRTAGASTAPYGASELPYVPAGYGPEELATRTKVMLPSLGVPSGEETDERFRFLGSPLGMAKTGTTMDLPNEEDKENDDVDGVENAKETDGVGDEKKCETCAKRKYRDGSDDPGVSFKTARHVDPSAAGAAVRGHEQEHVVRERAKAERENRKVVSQSVTYHMGICPECGRFYVAGGTTRTVTAANPSKEKPDALEIANSLGGLDASA